MFIQQIINFYNFRIIVFSIPWFRIILLRATIRGLSQESAECVINHVSFGDWFVLRQLSKNINPIVFQELILEIASRTNKLHV